jgi:multimeric flavodoxin WrbA
VFKVLAIAGSPRRQGNTDVLLDRAIAGAVEKGAEVERVALNELRIAPCIECNRCYATGHCAVQDDFQDLYNKALLANGIILASPVFFMSVTGFAKAFIDRFQSLWALKYVLKQPVPPPPGGHDGRRAIFLSTAGAPHTKFNPTLSTVRAFLATIDAQLVGKLCVNGMDDKGDVLEHPSILQQSHALGAQLVTGPVREGKLCD